MYNDDLEEKGFISVQDIFRYVDEESIYEMVFGFRPTELEYVESPFREDDNPGCWFEYGTDGKLRFVDFADNRIINGVKMNNIDCFDAVKVYFNLPNFYKTLEFIWNHLIEGKDLDAQALERSKVIKRKTEKKEVQILFETRFFDKRDEAFWSSRGITSQNLKDDKVFAVKKYKILNSKKGNFLIKPASICYAYTDFRGNKVKLYCPYADKKGKFITNCTQNDIGGLSSLEYNQPNLIITKSYKDWRVIKNQGYNTIWFQNEGMIPDIQELTSIFDKYEEIIIFFDNDKAGKEASNKVKSFIESNFKNKVKTIFLPEYEKEVIKDPSDLIFYRGKEKLTEFLYESFRNNR